MITLPLHEIDATNRVRQIDRAHAADLAESIYEDGVLLHPIVVTKDKKLIAGGHRLAAFQFLKQTYPDDARWENIPVTYIEDQASDLSPAKGLRLELEENIRRLDMKWQDKVIGIYQYHKLRIKERRIEGGDKWTQAMTGRMLKLSQGHVSPLLYLAEKMMANLDSPLWSMDSMQLALEHLVKEKLDSAQRILVRSAQANRPAAPAPLPVVDDEEEEAPTLTPTISFGGSKPKPQSQSPSITLEAASELYWHGNCLEYLHECAQEGKTFDHIITDPPFGIDMNNLDQTSSIDRVADTHEVANNVQMLELFLRLAYKVLPESGFLAMWYDLDHHEKLAKWATDAGFLVCRWPFIWCKTSPCRNSAAQYNITKATEVCYIFRKKDAVISEKLTKNYVLAASDPSATHPFYKPVEVWMPLIETFTHPGQTILDPFAGEGSFAVAALSAGRHVQLVEIEEKHIMSGAINIHNHSQAAPLDLGDSDDPFATDF